MTDLIQLNESAHTDIDERWLSAMEHLIALDLDAARAAWERYLGALNEHTDREDAAVLPAWEALGELPRGSSMEIMEGEHRKIRELAAGCGETLARLAAAPLTGRAVLGVLDEFYRLRHLLEHHGIRETKLIYPGLIERADPAVVRAIAEALVGDAPSGAS